MNFGTVDADMEISEAHFQESKYLTLLSLLAADVEACLGTKKKGTEAIIPKFLMRVV